MTGSPQAVLDTTRKACREKFSLELIFIWSLNGKHLHALMVMWKYDLWEVRSLPMLKQIWNDIHIKRSAGQVIAVNDFCSIYKATILSAAQILGIEVSRFVESLRLKDKLFPFLTPSNSILTCRNWTYPWHFPSQISRLVYEVYECIAGQQHGCWQVLCFCSTIRNHKQLANELWLFQNNKNNLQ